MKIIKPLKLGLLFKTFEYRGRCFWSPALLIFFDFQDRPQLETEVDLWKLVPQRLGQQILDEAMPKSRAEILVNGSFFAPGHKPVTAGQIKIKIGPVDKTLYIYGNRYWKRSPSLAWIISDPEPMLEMPIDWGHSFGGPDYKPNPLGRGTQATKMPGHGKVVALPNVELPGQLIGSPKDRPPPAGLGPIDLTWPQRFSKCGTYGKQWFEERFPGLPDDIDWTFFNTAPTDQQIDGFFSGNETFVVEGMHPDHKRLEGRLPAVRPRCFICRQSSDQARDLEELELNLDTVWLFPDVLKGLLIYRGLTEVSDSMAKEITKVLMAYEKLDSPARNLEHYRQALEKRSDPQKAGLTLLDETDLIAEGERSGIAELMAADDGQQQQWEQLLQKKLRLRMENDLKQVRASLASQGLDPDKILPLPEPVEYDPTDIDKLLAEAKDARRKSEQVLAGHLKQLGLTKQQLVEQAETKPAPRPVFSAARAVETFRSIGIESNELTKKMLAIEETFFQSYRQFGHKLPPVIPPGPETDEERIQILIRACKEGTSLADMDLAGLDLSGMELSGANLAGAFLEGVSLAGADLCGADLSNCALMRADLSGAMLKGAKIRGAGLGRSKLTGANFTGADLDGAYLVEADLCGTIFVEASLAKADLSQVKALKADFRRATITNVRFIEADFSGANFSQADLGEGIFIQTVLKKADFNGCKLVKATLVKTDATEADFSNVRFDNLRAAADCICEKTSFRHAWMEGANLRGARLKGANFDQANLDSADLSEADLRQTSFRYATAKKALFMESDMTAAKMTGANLFESLLHKANLEQTDLQGTNLFGVDFMKARFRNTDVRQALTAKSTLLRWMPKK